MNSRTGKFFTALVVLMIVMNLMLPIAGAARACTDHPCCCRDNIVGAHHEAAPVVYSAENGCCSGASRVPCNLNEDFGRHSSIFAVSSTRNHVSCETVRIVSADVVGSYCGTYAEFNAKSQFRASSDPVPIYLNTLALIC